MTPAYLTDIQIAKMLGRSKNWLCAIRNDLEREGFPRRDALIGLTCKADIEAWIARRRQVADADTSRNTMTGDHHISLKGENLNAL